MSSTENQAVMGRRDVSIVLLPSSILNGMDKMFPCQIIINSVYLWGRVTPFHKNGETLYSKLVGAYLHRTYIGLLVL